MDFTYLSIDAPPFSPNINYRRKETTISDDVSRAPLTDAQRGYAELLTGGNNNFSAPYTGFVPDEGDVPY